MHLADNYVSISGAYIKCFKAEPVVRTPTVPAKVEWGPSSAVHSVPFGPKTHMLPRSRDVCTDRYGVRSPGSASGMMWKQAQQDTRT